MELKQLYQMSDIAEREWRINKRDVSGGPSGCMEKRRNAANSVSGDVHEKDRQIGQSERG